MYHEKTVVTLCDSNKKPFREHSAERLDKGRKCKVYIPFESEYQFLLKNNTDRRIRLEVDIDGTNVTDSGIIVPANTTSYLERFLNEAKKFKFVPLSNEGVADPTSKENGVIKIRVAQEKKVNPFTFTPFVKKEEHHHHHYHDYWNDYWNKRPYYPTDPLRPFWYSSGTGDIMNMNLKASNSVNETNDGTAPCSDVTSASYSLNDITIKNTSCSYVAPEKSDATLDKQVDSILRSCSLGQPGATVEGSKSDQTFISSEWAGDEEISFFTFELLGLDKNVDPEYLEYLRLQEKFGKK